MQITWLGIVAVGILFLTACGGYRRGFVREIMSFFFVFLALALAWMINPYVNEFMTQKTEVYEKIQESCQGMISSQMTEENQENEKGEDNSVINNLNLPEILQKNLADNNTIEVYQKLAVDSVGEYVSKYLADMIVGGLSYLISYVLANLILKLIGCVLNIITELPLINGANRLTGAVVGIAKGILFLWIALLVLTVLCSTEIGKTGLELVEKDAILNTLYRYDVLVKTFLKFFPK